MTNILRVVKCDAGVHRAFKKHGLNSETERIISVVKKSITYPLETYICENNESIDLLLTI